jgi:hypothetical protein
MTVPKFVINSKGLLMKCPTPSCRTTSSVVHVCLFNIFPANLHVLWNLPQLSGIEGKKWQYNETVHKLFIDFKKAYESVRREVLYNIFIESGIPMKLVRLIKMCLNETYSKVYIGKHLSDSFLIQNGLKEGDALEYAIRKVQEN